MVEVEITNFQSIEKVNFKVDKFTALSGPSNIGKSALVRAIQFALTNARGTYFVRHGDTCLRRVKGLKTCKCKSTVHIKADGFDLFWQKGDSINRTIVNGVEYDKPEGTEFLDALGLAAVDIGSDSTLLQVADQFDPPFLLNASGPAVAELVSDVGQLAVINKAIGLADKDRKESSTLRKIREKDVTELGDRLSAYAGLDSQVKEIATLEAKLEHIGTLEGKVATVTGLIDRLAKVGGAVQALTHIEKIVIPSVEAPQASIAKLTTIVRLLGQLSVKLPAFRALEGVDKVTVPTVDGVSTAGEKFSQLSRFVSMLEVKQPAVAALDGVESVSVPTLDDSVAKLATKATALTKFHAQVTSKSAAVKSLSGVEAITVPELTPLHETAVRLRNVAVFVRRLSTLQKDIGALEVEEQKLATEEAGIVEETNLLGVCPTCVQPVKGAHEHMRA